ncbi:MAG TPA: TadE family protein, partial [Albitalea sp.]|nr:TadE family protein [Albitalea sp.]
MIVLPICLFAVLALMQAALVYYAKSNLNYAAYEAARAGSVSHASQAAIHAAFQKALLPYYGGGRTPTELQRTAVNATRDLAESTVRVEILSPTQQSFSDYNSPALQTQLRVSEPAIPNVGLDELS